MARKSRKAGCQISSVCVSEKRAHVGLYARLSVTDNGYKSADSIENQIQLLKQYVISHEDELLLEKEYIDNGTTGTNFDRQAWNELLTDMKRGTINCIIVKDFSRLGRNYIEVGNYLEKIFPFLGVRIIALNENFDSKIDQFNEKMLIGSLTNIINEYYAKDISKKITQTKRTMQKKGEFASSVLPYGYVCSEKNKKKLVPDPGVAMVVTKIFQWRIDGKGCLHIARLLNELLIPSPGLYRYMNGSNAFSRCANSKWKSKHVAGILTNPIYMGNMVQGKTRTSYFENNGKVCLVPKEEWIIVENTHEPLITPEQFCISEHMAEKSKKRHYEQLMANEGIERAENAFERKIYCGQCGRLLVRRSRVSKVKRDYCFFCNSVEQVLDGHCKNTHIHEEPLLETVKMSLEKQFEIVGGINNEQRQQYLEQKTRDKRKENQRKYKQLENKIDICKHIRQEMYADMKEGLLTKEDYTFGTDKLNLEIRGHEEELKKLLTEVEEEEQTFKILEEYKNIIFSLPNEGISRELIGRLVEKIVVYSPERVEMTFSVKSLSFKEKKGDFV